MSMGVPAGALVQIALPPWPARLPADGLLGAAPARRPAKHPI